MASAKDAAAVEAQETEITNEVVDAAAQLGVRRYFTIPAATRSTRSSGRSATRTIPGKDGPGVRAEGRRVPEVLVADRDEHRRAEVLPRPPELARPRALREADDRPRRRHDRRLGPRRRLLRRRRGGADLPGRAEVHPRPPARVLQRPVWFNVGFEEKPQCSACFILSIDDSMESILDWIRREGVIFRGGSGSGVNLSRLRSSKEQLSKGGYASGPVSFMRGADASAGTIKSGGKTRRAAKMVVLDVDHPDVEEFIWCKAKEERKARVLEAAGYDMSLDSPDWASIQYQNANNSVRVTDAFMEAVVEGKEWNLTARTDGAVARDRRGARADAADRRGRVGVRRPGRPVRHDDQRLAHAAEHEPHQRVEPVLGVHVDRRQRLQPRLAQPDEVPARGRRARRRGARARGRDDVPRAGDPRRLLVVSDARDRAQRGRVPPARARLREPRRAADGARAPVRLRRGSRLRGRDHGADDGSRVPQVGRDRRPDGPVRRATGRTRRR